MDNPNKPSTALTERERETCRALWEKTCAKLYRTATDNIDKIPYIQENGKWSDMTDTDITWWTNGFWGGLNWLAYIGGPEKSRDVFKTAAQNCENALDKAFMQQDKLNHDVGFMWHITAGVNYRLFGDAASKARATLAANLLAARYNPAGRFIRAWNGEDNTGWVIIDSMMNIPLLYWASDEYGDPRFRHIATNHADTLMRTHIRPDGSARHIVNLDPDNGEIIEVYGGQGYDRHSAWSRGQAWALYGFTLSYIHTGRKEYLDTAKRVANYFIAAVSDNWRVLADFRAPSAPVVYDSTAAACAACGLIEMARCVPELEGRTYLSAAMNILSKLAEEACDFSDDTHALLGFGTEAYDRPRTMHVPIIYGDYFFTEALYKICCDGLLFW